MPPVLQPRRLALLVAAALWVGVPGAATADDTPPDAAEAAKQKALKLFEDGARAFAQGRYHDAVDRFLAGDRVIQNAAFAYNIARSYERVGDTSRALRWAREFLRRAPDAPKAEEMSALVETLQRRLEEKGVQQITVHSAPAGATVDLDGRPVGVTPWTGDVIPGSHSITARLRDHDDLTKTVDVPRDRAIDVTLTLTPAPPEPSVAPAPPPPQPAPEPVPLAPPTLNPIRADDAFPIAPWTLATLGAGAIGLGVGIGLEVARGGAEDDARAASTQLEALAEAKRMDDFQLGARVAVGVGAGLLAVGGALVVVDLLGGDGDAEPTVTGACSIWACSGTLHGSF